MAGQPPLIELEQRRLRTRGAGSEAVRNFVNECHEHVEVLGEFIEEPI
jgi:hypothetical protein